MECDTALSIDPELPLLVLQAWPAALLDSRIWTTMCLHPSMSQLCPWTQLLGAPATCELALWLKHLDLLPQDDRQACHNCHVLLQAIVAREAWEGDSKSLFELLGTPGLATLGVASGKVVHLLTLALDYQFDCQSKLNMDPITVQCDDQPQYPQYRSGLC